MPELKARKDAVAILLSRPEYKGFGERDIQLVWAGCVAMGEVVSAGLLREFIEEPLFGGTRDNMGKVSADLLQLKAKRMDVVASLVTALGLRSVIDGLMAAGDLPLFAETLLKVDEIKKTNLSQRAEKDTSLN